jgi:outer membrane protein OmpA-like peptidoglycan-associated protein
MFGARTLAIAPVVIAGAAALLGAPRSARADTAADPTEVGVWFGPRIFSDSSNLGYVDGASFHEQLNGAIEFGARVARPFFPWLVPELELAMAPTSSSAPGTMVTASVFWFEPRLHVRFELLPHHQVQPFLLVGAGASIAASSARMTYDSGVVGDGYAGGGVRFDTQRGVTLRLDARLDLIPSITNGVTLEADFGFGLEFHVGEHRPAPRHIFTPPPDRDNDGIPDAKDKCPDRPEDKDGFQDEDGCPDIDNDNDRVLDIADKCPNVPETYNGFEDEDGCPDTVPADVDALRGTIEGLLYADGETAVRDSAEPSLKKIASVMAAHKGIRVVLMGYTDDREAKQFAGSDAVDLTQANADLSHARADAVRIELEKLGVGSGRIDVEGHGTEDPVGDNETPRGRLANRRVEIKLFVPSAR